MVLGACRYTVVSAVKDIDAVGAAVRLSNLDSTSHFFRPALVVREERYAWGHETGEVYSYYDVEDGLSSVPRLFRKGGRFNISLTFVLMIKLLREHDPPLWIHVPGTPRHGLAAPSRGYTSQEHLSLLAEPRAINEASRLLARLLPAIVQRDGASLNWNDGAVRPMVVRHRNVPSCLSALLSRYYEGSFFSGIAADNYYESGLWDLTHASGPDDALLSVPDAVPPGAPEWP